MALPPTSSKLSSDANEVTTFKFDFPHFTGTHTGTLVSLDVNSVVGGGTGLASLTANNVILGNGTSAPTFVAPGSSGNVLTSSGGTWISSPATGGGANTALSNLITTSINQSLLFNTDFTYDIGSTTDQLANLWAYNLKSSSSLGIEAQAGNDVTIFTEALAGSTASGGISLLTGNVSPGSGATGGITLATGTPTSGTRGTIAFKDGSEGTAGNVWTSTDVNGNGHWSSLLTASAFASYASTQITTDSSSISSGTFTTFSNSPAFTIMPTITGTYKIYCSLLVQAAPNNSAIVRIFNTSGAATLLSESQGAILASSASSLYDSIYVQSTYTLTAGNTYVFDIQGNNGGAGSILNRGSIASFYMFAEGIGLVTSSPTGSYAQAYFGNASTWTTASGSFSTGTNSGGNALTVRTSSNITLTAAASNNPGITFTPPNSSAVYLITASIVGLNSAGGGPVCKLNDGTVDINSAGIFNTGGNNTATITLSGIYAPATSSPVTVNVLFLSLSGTVQIGQANAPSTIEWTVLRIV